MSHRKFEHPRCGSLGFLPKKRSAYKKGKIKAFPIDRSEDPVHLTAFLGYKAGMTHVLRQVDRPKTMLDKKETVDAVTIIETPPLRVVGMVGYVSTPNGLRMLTSVFAGHLGKSFKRRMYKNWYSSKKKAFSAYSARVNTEGDGHIESELARIAKYCSVVRLIVHTEILKVSVNQKKAHVAEIQINGGSVADKVAFGKPLFEQTVDVGSVFQKDEMVDAIGITRGRGFQGVITRWGVTRLPRKTHRGLRKVACIGSWHPSRVAFTIARAGQMGYHHRVEVNKKIFKIGKASNPDKAGNKKIYNGSTEADLTKKDITPLGGFVHYGNVNEDYVMIKGSVPGPKKRVITLRKTLSKQANCNAKEVITLSFIDTSSSQGKGKFQTKAEKDAFMGPSKKQQQAAAQ